MNDVGQDLMDRANAFVDAHNIQWSVFNEANKRTYLISLLALFGAQVQISNIERFHTQINQLSDELEKIKECKKSQ